MSQSQTFAHTNESVGEARRFASQAIRGAPADVVEAVALMVSELATNCIRHTDSRFELTVTRAPEEIRVQATDRGTGQPVLRNPGPAEPTGRGLQIVDLLASDWGIEDLGGRGKAVWFTIPVPAGDRIGEPAVG